MIIKMHVQLSAHNYLKKIIVNSNQEFAKERGPGRGGFNPKLKWVKQLAISDSLQ